MTPQRGRQQGVSQQQHLYLLLGLIVPTCWCYLWFNSLCGCTHLNLLFQALGRKRDIPNLSSGLWNTGRERLPLTAFEFGRERTAVCYISSAFAQLDTSVAHAVLNKFSAVTCKTGKHQAAIIRCVVNSSLTEPTRCLLWSVPWVAPGKTRTLHGCSTGSRGWLKRWELVSAAPAGQLERSAVLHGQRGAQRGALCHSSPQRCGRAEATAALSRLPTSIRSSGRWRFLSLLPCFNAEYNLFWDKID